MTDAGHQVKNILAYNGMGQPTQIEHKGLLTSITYTREGRIDEMLIGDRLYDYEYDEAGRLVSTQQPNGQRLTYFYDEAGRRTGTQDSFGNRYELRFNEANQVTQKTYQSFDNQVSRTLNYVYDATGKIEEAELDGVRYRRRSDLTDTANAEQSTDTQYTDGDSAQALLAQPGRLVTKYLYDAKQQLSAVQDPRANTTHYAHDDFGRLVEIRSPEFGVVRYTYDEANNILSEQDADGNITENTYDAANRLITSESNDAQYSWHYNAEGRVHEIHSPSESQYYEYNRYGQVTLL